MIRFRTTAAFAVSVTTLGLAGGAVPAPASSTSDLEGTWVVAQMTMSGSPRTDGKALNATWTFRGAELVVQAPTGERLRAALSFDATAEPPAFHVAPIDPSTDRPLWVVWARQGDQLRLAYYDGVERRPEDFGPRHKLVVLTLERARTASAPVALDPCKVLRRAGIDRLLGGPARPRRAPRHPTAAGSSCALDRADGARAVSLTLVGPPAGAAYVDIVREETRADGRMPIEEEPALGPGAFSGARGWTVVMVALRNGTAMILTFEAFGAERAELRRFASRVLDAL